MWIRGILAMLAASMVVSVARADAERPPQFVMLAFDGGISLPRWQDLGDFSAAMKRDGKPVNFTIFVSGIAFVEDANRNVYQGPGQRRGYSAINFGGKAEDVQKRVDLINAMYASGHEIASHANGHFNGAHWSAAQWEQEFAAYRAIYDNASPMYSRGSADKIEVPLAKIIGFRAPYLATGPGLYEALRRAGFRYDTSGIALVDQWPRKSDGLWHFDLVQLKVGGRRALSMDYNFFVAQSGAHPDPRHADVYRAQMLASYLDYFRTNYNGNRAPLNIGHHFEAMQGGVYNEALKDFARQVCGLPEVRCATYSELADYMDAQSPETIAAYQAGAFPHAAMPTVTAAAVETPAMPAAKIARTAMRAAKVVRAAPLEHVPFPRDRNMPEIR
jgi:hypothetical protein